MAQVVDCQHNKGVLISTLSIFKGKKEKGRKE
jgi:hypothetical protein